MNGRYFGGRVVKAKFYDLDKFRQFDLADDS
jgi:splicing factor 45